MTRHSQRLAKLVTMYRTPWLWPRRMRYVCYLLVAAFTMVAAYRGWCVPQGVKFNRLVQQEAELKQNFPVELEKLRAMQNTLAQQTLLLDQLNKLYATWPTTTSAKNALTELQILLQKAHIELLEMKALDLDTSSLFAIQRVAIKTTLPYHDIAYFIHHLCSAPLLMTLQELHIERSEDDDDPSVDLILGVYLQPKA